MAEDLVLEGFIKKVLYPKHRLENPGDFAIFVFSITSMNGKIDNRAKNKYYKEGEITLKGNVPELSPSTKYKVHAELVNDKKYGYSYEIKTMCVYADFNSEDGVKKFLYYILTPAQVDNIYKVYDHPINIIKNADIEALSKVKGIGGFTAKKIIEKYKAAEDNYSAYSVLYDYGLTKRMIDRLIEIYKSPQTLVDKVTKNPYILIEECNGIGWMKADSMAMKAGLAKDSEARIKAYIKYYFDNIADTDGHTWVLLSTLVANIKALVPTATNEKLQSILRDAVDKKLLYYKRDTKQIGLYKYRILEENIYNELIRLASYENEEELKYIDETISECEEAVGFKYTEEQVNAIKKICHENVVLLTAISGCGKSSLMYPVARILRRNGKSFSQCALSGKASLNLQTVTQEYGCTIHKLLGGGVGSPFEHDKNNKLDEDAIILDEVSMIGGELFYSLIQSIKDGAKLIMIGDPGQLESIGICNLISDIVTSGRIKNVRLTKIFRQAAMSGIIVDSMKIYNQTPIIKPNFIGNEIHGELKDFYIISRFSKEECIKEIVEKFKELYFKQNIPISDIVIATAKRCSGGLSSVELNLKIQELLKLDDQKSFNVGYSDSGIKYSLKYHVGDRVIVTQNMYDVFNEQGAKTAIFNGNIGTITVISNNTATIDFGFDVIKLGTTLFEDIQLGYAVTTHKLQGSGIPYVISVADPGAFAMLTKEFLYTSITRAKKMCYLVGTPKSINTCVKTTRVIKKQTWLGQLLAKKDFCEIVVDNKDTDDV